MPTPAPGISINVEYVSANPTGPMHIGHCRGAVVGDALANLLTKAGYRVTKEYYINDAGAQVIALAWAAYLRYLQAIGSPITEEIFAQEVPGGLQYRGEYLVDVGRILAERYQVSLATPELGIASPELWLDTVKDITIGRDDGRDPRRSPPAWCAAGHLLQRTRADHGWRR